MKRTIMLLGFLFVVAASLVVAVRTQSGEAAINTVVTDTGKISLSVDGLGTVNSTGLVQVDKPAGGTVRSAHFACASLPGAAPIPDGSITIDSTGITWSLQVVNGGWQNHYADVTAVVSAGLNSAPAGVVNLTIGEASPFQVDGCVLAVIFNDPAVLADRTAVLLFGGQSTTGDTFTITLADPINTADPGLVLDMGLGISYSFQGDGPASHACGTGSAQSSRLDVNGTRLSTCAGNFDDADGDGQNGNLLTVGGVGDSNNNPSDPNQGPGDGGTPRVDDDELYNLIPFVQNGDTQISVATLNASNDDNIFFAHVLTLGTARVTTENCTDGIDNDGDGLIDLADPDCQEAATATPTDTPTPDVVVTETVAPTRTAQATRTVQVTRTVAATRTVQATQTVAVTRTVQVTPTVDPATSTPVPTNTNTPIPTSTTAPATVVPTHTVAVTQTAQATRTVRPATATAEPEPECITKRARLQLLIGILRRFGTEEGDRRYREEFDLNGDGVIDFADVEMVLAVPLCQRHRHR